MVTVGQVHCRRPPGVLPTALSLLPNCEWSGAIGLGALYSFYQEVFPDLRGTSIKGQLSGLFWHLLTMLVKAVFSKGAGWQ